MDFREWRDKYVDNSTKYGIIYAVAGKDSVYMRANQMAIDQATDWILAGNPLRAEQVSQLHEYASAYGIKLAGFEAVDIDVELVKEMLDDCSKVLNQFPELRGKVGQIFTLRTREMPKDDFAETDRNDPFSISLNTSAFRSKEQLACEYKRLSDSGYFVSGTDYHSIIFHEFGHLYSFAHSINGIGIMKRLSQIHHKKYALQYVRDNISIYASKDSGEITAECFSAYFGKIDPGQLVLTFVQECARIANES
jgi:hypothetical protein